MKLFQALCTGYIEGSIPVLLWYLFKSTKAKYGLINESIVGFKDYPAVVHLLFIDKVLNSSYTVYVVLKKALLTYVQYLHVIVWLNKIKKQHATPYEVPVYSAGLVFYMNCIFTVLLVYGVSWIIKLI